MEGVLPPEISKLDKLRELNFSDNEIGKVLINASFSCYILFRVFLIIFW